MKGEILASEYQGTVFSFRSFSLRCIFANALRAGVASASALVLSLTISLSSASADYIDPSLTKVSTSRYAPNRLIFNPGKYVYSVRWQGIPVATAEVVLGQAPQLVKTSLPQSYLTIRASTKTARIIDLLYKLRFTSESVFDPLSLQPIRFISEQTENRKYKRYEVEFGKDTQVTSKLYRSPGTSELDEEDSKSFLSDNLTVDPLFGGILARSIPAGVGSSADFDVWNGKHRYLITFRVVEREEIRIGREKILADKIVPEVKRLTDSEGEKRLRYAALWVSADERREILKLESKVLVGSISATLESFTPLEPAIHPPALLQAQDRATVKDAAEARASLKSDKDEAETKKP